MSSDDFSDIFDASSKKPGTDKWDDFTRRRKRRREDVAARKKSKPGLPKAPKTPAEYVKRKLDGYEERKKDYEDVDAAFDRIVKEHQRIKKEIDELFEKVKLSPEMVQRALNSRKVFSAKQWQILEKIRNMEEKRIWKALGRHAPKHKMYFKERRALRRTKKKGAALRKRGERGKGGWKSID